MPKKKPATKKEPNDVIFLNKLKAFYRKRPWLFIIVAGLLLWGTIWLSQVAVERYKFNQAENKIDQLANTIQSNIGNTERLEKESNCSYSSKKYGRGDRSCRFYYSLDMTVSNAEEASKITNSILNIVKNTDVFDSKIISINDLPFQDKDAYEGLEEQNLSINFDNQDEEPSCSASTTFSIFPNRPDVGIPKEDSILAIRLGCSGSAKMEYFPVR